MTKKLDPEVYVVAGINPEPWRASESARSGRNKLTVYKNEGLRSYQEALKSEFTEKYPRTKPTSAPCMVTFLFWRELGKYKLGDGVGSSRHYADATNLQKSTEDALQGVLYTNDKLVRVVRSVIMQQDETTNPAIVVLFQPYFDTPPDVAEYAELAIESVPPSPDPQKNIRPKGTVDF